MNLLEDELPDLLLEKIESKAICYLEAYDEDYQELVKERSTIIDSYHNMLNFLEYNKPIQLSEEEHGMMIHYLEIENRINDIVKFMIYLYGHANCSSYLQIMNILQDKVSKTNEARETL